MKDSFLFGRVDLKRKVFSFIFFYLFIQNSNCFLKDFMNPKAGLPASKLLTMLRTNAMATEVSEGQKRGVGFDDIFFEVWGKKNLLITMDSYF